MAGFSREVAKRVFSEELRNSNLSFRDGEDQHQYAPMYLLTPTGAKCNRVFMVGTLTERDDIGGDTEYWRGRIVDPTGSILIYAGQYQPEAAQKLSSIEPPAYVAVVGKPNLYQTEDGTVVISLRAEAIQKVDEATRDRWILDTAGRTQERLKVVEEAATVSGEFSSADKAPALPSMDVDRAKQHYNTDITQYRKMVIRALNSLRSDLGQGREMRPIGAVGAIEAVELDASRASAVEPEISRPDEAKVEADQGNVKPETKGESPKKSKSKASAAKETNLSGFPGSEQDEVETIPVFKKS
jgi:RPA family protein